MRPLASHTQNDGGTTVGINQRGLLSAGYPATGGVCQCSRS